MRIKSTQNWRRHLAGSPSKLQASRDYYVSSPDRWRRRIKFIVISIACLLIVQAFFQIKFLQLKKFTFASNGDLTLETIKPTLDEVLSRRRWVIFQNNNYFLFKHEKLADALVSTYNLDKVELNKKFPQTLNISLTEKISQYLWQKNNNLYLVDAHGEINRLTHNLDDKYLLLDDQRPNGPIEGKVLSDSDLEAINLVYLAWTEVLGDNPKLARVILTENPPDWRWRTQVGYDVLLDINDDLNLQLNNLQRVLAGEIVSDNIDYIDLRFGDRIFFK